MCRFPKDSFNKRLERKELIYKRRVAEQIFSSRNEETDNGQTANLLQKLKEIMRILQKNQKILSVELNVSATTVSAYFTGKKRSKGWALFERRVIQWIVSQNMDSALVENPDDEGLLQDVQICKKIQWSLVEECGNSIQPTKDRFWSQESACISDNDPQFNYMPQVNIPSQCPWDLWMRSSDVQLDNYCCTPNLSYYRDDNSKTTDDNAYAEFDHLGRQQQQPQIIVESQFESAPLNYYYYGSVEIPPELGYSFL